MDSRTGVTLGTLLRHLIEHLDGAVEARYADAGLAFRPRYTPVVRALLALRSASIQEIAQHAGLTHSAASQTVSQMTKARLVRLQSGEDARTRIVSLTPRALAMVPLLKRVWASTNEAAARLEAELSYPLLELLQETIAALEREPFLERIDDVTRRGRRRTSRPSRTGNSTDRTLAARRT